MVETDGAGVAHRSAQHVAVRGKGLKLKPNGIDDGDADDIHRYNNWYAPSSFVTDAKLEKEVKNNAGTRPLIGQEMSSGYPDLDTGLPVLRYTRDLLTPQAWVGPHSSQLVGCALRPQAASGNGQIRDGLGQAIGCPVRKEDGQ